MSYALTLPSAAFYDAPLSSALGADSISPECQKAASAFMKVAIAVGLTSDAVRATVEKCCQQFQKSKKSSGDRAKDMAECFVRAGAGIGGAAACTAVGAAAVAGICATIATWVTDRVLGYSPLQLGIGIAAGGFCAAVSGGSLGSACFFVGAELGEWIDSTIGPLVSGVLNPSAAKDREIKRRKVENEIHEKTTESVTRAEAIAAETWQASVNRLWDLFEQSFVTSADLSAAAGSLGLGPSYGSIAMALARAGALVSMMPATELAKHKVDTYAACEVYGRKKNGTFGPLSPICPPFVRQMFEQDPRHKGSPQQLVQLANEMADITNEFFLRLQIAEAYIATKITAFAIARKAAALAAAQKSIDTYLSSAQKAAARAQAASIVARTGTLAASDSAAASAAASAVTAENAVKSMLALALSSNEKPGDRGTRALAAADAAKKSAAAAKQYNSEKHLNRILVGTALAAGVAGGAYLFLRSRS